VDARRIDLNPRSLGRPRTSSNRPRKKRLAAAVVLGGLVISGILTSGRVWPVATGVGNFPTMSFRTTVHKAVPLETNGTDVPIVVPPSPPPAPPVVPEPDVDTSSAVAWAASPGVACIRDHESGDNYQEDTGNGYYGAYQDLLSTWEAHGGTGLPSDAPPALQDQINYEIYLSGGWGQWSTAVGCGL
jgi:hypothetical protein